MPALLLNGLTVINERVRKKRENKKKRDGIGIVEEMGRELDARKGERLRKSPGLHC